MATVLAMKQRHSWLAVPVLLALAACGNDKNAGILGGIPVKDLATATMAEVGLGPKPKPAAPAPPPDPAQVALARKTLEEGGIPLFIIQNKNLGLAAYFSKLGQNGDVITWSTQDYKSISMRDGMIIATRGLGPDIMSSYAPTTEAVRRGSGTTKRVYYTLDAADQKVRQDFDCVLNDAGMETITLIGKPYSARRINETCTGPTGSFVNVFWFDGRAKLRQSSQHVALGIENLLLQKIID
jgi:hypothetical protein